MCPNVGDWYYSDGTISTELDPSKTVLGIVFWVGDPTADDASLAREHPSCIHGLVMSLDEESSKWHSEYEAYGGFIGDWVAQNAAEYFSCAVNKMTETDLFNRIAGYNNSFGKCRLAGGCRAESCGLPDRSSGTG